MLRVSMQYMTALVMANMHCDVLRILAAVKWVVYLTVDVRQIKINIAAWNLCILAHIDHETAT